MAVHVDRRRSFRIAMAGDLLLWRRGRFAGDYRLADLSLGGCALHEGPSPDLGERFDATLRIPGAPPIALPVRIVRRRRGGPAGICFEQSEPAVEDEIHDILVSKLECRDDLAGDVLLVHPRPEFAVSLVTMLERLGHRVRVAGTPLEAIWQLEDSAASVHTAIVAGGMREHGTDCAQMFAFLARTYPRIRRVLMTPQSDGAVDAGRAHAVLQGPLDLGGLRKVLPDSRSGARHDPETVTG